ncbi:MAG: hypothetical protein ACXWPM_03860 [Bdellovibrionota bacterium]
MANLSGAWDVLMLFLIPIGGGIPAGVVLAKSHALPWPEMVVLYFISDVILACLFEPLMLLLAKGAKRMAFLARWNEALKKSMQKTTARYGSHLGPLALILVSFGVDPMTGRSVSAAAGHGFVSGWMLAITGDMLFFVLLMVSTLWLNNVLGDGTWTTVIMLVVMMVVPSLVRRLFPARLKRTGQSL